MIAAVFAGWALAGLFLLFAIPWWFFCELAKVLRCL
jgi:hypothetical protein